MTESIISLGLQMMCIGMGFVLCFLCILIVSMIVMSKVVGYLNKIFPEVVETPKKQVKSSNDEEIAVAIAAIKALG